MRITKRKKHQEIVAATQHKRKRLRTPKIKYTLDQLFHDNVVTFGGLIDREDLYIIIVNAYRVFRNKRNEENLQCFKLALRNAGLPKKNINVFDGSHNKSNANKIFSMIKKSCEIAEKIQARKKLLIIALIAAASKIQRVYRASVARKALKGLTPSERIATFHNTLEANQLWRIDALRHLPDDWRSMSLSPSSAVKHTPDKPFVQEACELAAFKHALVEAGLTNDDDVVNAFNDICDDSFPESECSKAIRDELVGSFEIICAEAAAMMEWPDLPTTFYEKALFDPEAAPHSITPFSLNQSRGRTAQQQCTPCKPIKDDKPTIDIQISDYEVEREKARQSVSLFNQSGPALSPPEASKATIVGVVACLP